MVALLLSIAALAVSLATLGVFLYAVYKSKPTVHSYWPCYRCGRPVAIRNERDVEGRVECNLCLARNR